MRMSQATLAPKVIPLVGKGLVAYWKMGEANGADRRDSHNRFLLSQAGTVTQETGKIGNATGLAAGSSQYLSSTAAGLMVPSTAVPEFTLDGFFTLSNKAGFAFQDIITRWDATGGHQVFQIQFVSGDDQLKLFHSTTGSNSTTTVIDTAPAEDAWFYLALRVTATTIDLRYHPAGGSVTDISTVSAVMLQNDTTAPLAFGARFAGATPSVFWSGLADEVGLWGRYLSDAELVLRRNGGDGVTYPTFRG